MGRGSGFMEMNNGEEIVAAGAVKRRTIWGRVWRTALGLFLFITLFHQFVAVYIIFRIFSPQPIGQEMLDAGESTFSIPEKYTSDYILVDIRFQGRIEDEGILEELGDSIRVVEGVKIDEEVTTESGRWISQESSIIQSAGTKFRFFVGGIQGASGKDKTRTGAWMTIDEDGVLTRPLQIDLWRGH